MRRWVKAAAALGLLVALVACGGPDDGTGGGKAGGASAGGGSDARAALAEQLARLVAGDAEGLKACFTPRLRDRITPEVVAEAREEAASMTMDDLWASSEEQVVDGVKTVKVTMKNGRTLTTLVQSDGRWLADTIWFR